MASWSSIDYYGRWKGLHYAAKKFHAPVTVCVFLEEGKLRIVLANETRNAFAGTLKVKLCTSDLNVLEEAECSVCGEALSSTEVFSGTYAPEDPYSSFLCVELYEGENLLARRSELFAAPKHYNFQKPNVQVRFEQADGKTMAFVSADCYCKDVCLDFKKFDCQLSDNFFDLTDKEEYPIEIIADRSIKELEKNLQIMTTYDIGR